jgi:hypothetical protein
VQFDKTTIAVRQRGMLDTLDLSLHVLREYAAPLAAAMLLGVVPLMVANYLLLGWMAGPWDDEAGLPWRFIYHLSLQIYLQAPLAGIFATAYLGDAVFLEEPRLRDVIRHVVRMLPRIAWCHLLVRGVAAGWVLLLTVERDAEFDPAVEGFLLLSLVGYASLLRAFRPFINEIVLLERNPLRSQDKRVKTVGRRSGELHGASGGEWISRWLFSCLLGILLVLSTYGSICFVSGVIQQDWSQGTLLVQYLLPLAMWMVACYFTVFRFLTYLDARIRQEGWEVELQLRAEASRMVKEGGGGAK